MVIVTIPIVPIDKDQMGLLDPTTKIDDPTNFISILILGPFRNGSLGLGWSYNLECDFDKVSSNMITKSVKNFSQTHCDVLPRKFSSDIETEIENKIYVLYIIEFSASRKCSIQATMQVYQKQVVDMEVVFR